MQIKTTVRCIQLTKVQKTKKPSTGGTVDHQDFLQIAGGSVN